MANKTKHAMSQDTKDKARARKEPGTKARKFDNRIEQHNAAMLNRVRRTGGEATPWDVACAKRAAGRHGVAGAA